MGFGDELMTAGRVRVAQEKDPRKVRVMYEKGPRWSEAFDHNPRIAKLHEQGDFQIVHARVNYLRPYMAGKTAEKWLWQSHEPPKGELYFSVREREFANRYQNRIILEPHTKPAASPNKNWGWVRWNKLAYLAQNAGLRVTQLGRAGVPTLHGAEFIETDAIRKAAAVIAKASAVVTNEGAFHHIAAAVDTPAIVIRGGYISPNVTGYAGQVEFYAGGSELGCGMRIPCQHCADAMAQITPEKVLDKLMGIVNARMARPVAA